MEHYKIKTAISSESREKSGIFITFTCENVILAGDFLSLTDIQTESFKVVDVRTDDSFIFNVEAKQVGSSQGGLANKRIDLRMLINKDVALVTDQKEIQEIQVRSRYL